MLGAIVLGAGLSRRMGSEKLLLPFGDQKMLEKTIDGIAESFRGVIVVVTKKAVFNAIVKREEPIYLINDHPELGQATSLKIAVAYLNANYPECEGILVFLGDQPLIRKTLVDEMTRLVADYPEKIIMPEYKGRRGHPVAFGKHWMSELLAVFGDTGGRGVIEAHPEALIKIPGDKSCVMDADTPEDYQYLLEYYERKWSENEN